MSENITKELLEQFEKKCSADAACQVAKNAVTENGLKANRVQVQEMTKPLTISGVFPQIFEGESGVNVKV